MKHTMLHMKLNSAVSVFAVAAAFSVLLPPSDAYCGVCFLPDCGDDKLALDIPPNPNPDTEWCEKKGYTYYASGKCPQYQAQVGKCKRDDYYLKCDPVKWCTDNGYNTQSCSLPSFVDGQCPNGKPYYKQCKEDRPRACREAGYVNSCSPGRLYKGSKLCQWDSSYGTCCTASPSAGCPSNYSVNCDASRGSSGTDTCGYTCYRCCSDECSRGSKNYTGSKAGTTECGSICRYCNTSCSSGSTSYSGSIVGYNECGSACRSCSTSCPSGTSTSNPGGCGGSTTNECGTKTCYYPYQSCHSHSYSCPSGYSSSCSNGYSSTAYKECSCGQTSSTKCYKCNAASSGGDSGGGGSSWQYIRKASTSSGSSCWQDDGQWWHVCRANTYCKNGSTEKYICELSYAFGVGGAAQGWNKNSGFKTEAECRAAAAPNCASSVSEATLGSCDSSGNKSCSY
ncbi:MAG: hypothetical protein J6L86_02520 [Alphaproteobacteria bacterium]|nr:hypothetical protein [Alphaproteobacteria bacterium]